MYKIVCDDARVKIHWAPSLKIAHEVMNDLVDRFGNCTMDADENKAPIWDPGGMLIMDDEVHMFPIDNMSISCRAQHLSYFIDQVNGHNEPRGNKVKYYKIHGHYWCVCISEQGFNNLKNILNSPETKQEAEKFFEEREKKFKVLEDAGVIKRAVELDGKVYSLVKQENVDKKNIN